MSTAVTKTTKHYHISGLKQSYHDRVGHNTILHTTIHNGWTAVRLWSHKRHPHSSPWVGSYAVSVMSLITSSPPIYALVNWVSIGSDNGLSPGWHQAIIWTNAYVLSIRPQGTYFNEILFEIKIFLFTKMRLNMSSAKWWPFCPRGDELMSDLCSASSLDVLQIWGVFGGQNHWINLIMYMATKYTTHSLLILKVIHNYELPQ